MKTLTTTLVVVALALASVLPVFAAKNRWLVARIVSRRDTVHAVSGIVPGQARASCSANSGNVTCSETDTPSYVNSYNAGGAQFTLEFADGYVDVFCTSKYSLRFDYVNARSCRKPFGQDVEVMFVDRNRQAKLRWTTDGKHYESETYFISAFHSKSAAASPQLAQSAPPPAGADDSDVFYWFDEVPGPATQVRTVVITAKAYDHILTSLRNIRGGDTAVRVGASILDLNYHPASLAISAFAPDLSIVFHWNDEPLTNATPGFSTRVTKRTFEEITKLIPELRADVYTKHDIEPQEN